ncbi:hypothetical protein WAI453_001276 [Rhynchosporium graminicola]
MAHRFHCAYTKSHVLLWAVSHNLHSTPPYRERRGKKNVLQNIVRSRLSSPSQKTRLEPSADHLSDRKLDSKQTSNSRPNSHYNLSVYIQSSRHLSEGARE